MEWITFGRIAKTIVFRLTAVAAVGFAVGNINLSHSQPLLVIQPGPFEMNLGQTIDLDLTTVFFGGQQLASPPPSYVYNGGSDDPFVATFALGGDILTLTGVFVGAATITIQATDDLAASISTMFTVTVNPPLVGAAISDVSMEVSAQYVLDLLTVFPGGTPPYAFSTNSTDPLVANIVVIGSTLTVFAIAAGSTTVNVTATDGTGAQASSSFLVNVSPAGGQQISTCTRPLGEQYLDVNNVSARIVNTGGLFYRGEPHHYRVPKGSGSNAIFAAGIWIGGMINGQLHTAGAQYSQNEFWAGPLDDNGDPPVDCSVYDRVYKVSSFDVANYETSGLAMPDLADWPTGMGAPTLDAAGDPIDLSSQPFATRVGRTIDLASGERPQIFGNMTIWWVMNDRGNIHESTNTDPIGLEVHGSAFAAVTSVDALNNSTLYKYRVINHNTSTLEEAYFGVFADPDLGDFSDDYIGSNGPLNVGYVYNADNEDGGVEGYGTPPPAVGIAILKGPGSDFDGVDNDNDGIVDEPGEQLGMGHFMYYVADGSVTGIPTTGSEYYNYMRGRWKDGQQLTEGGIGRSFSVTPVNFSFPGDPSVGEFWSENNTDNLGSSSVPGDRRFVLSMGPFTLAPGEEAEVVFAVVYGLGSDNLDSVTAMKNATVEVRNTFNSGFSDFPQIVQPDELALIAFYNSTNGPNWTNNTNWATAAPIETWYGVTVTDGLVTRIDLSNNNVGGTLPTDIGSFQGLFFSLGLSGNQISGSIPKELGDLPNANIISLRDNLLTGTIPPQLANLQSLLRLDLSENQLSGEIPPGLKATSLYLNSNELTGPFPLGIGYWILDISDNQFSGEIPPEILDKTGSTVVLILNDNQFTGQIPPEIGKIPGLKFLFLGNNQFTGPIPKELGNLTDLEQLSLTGLPKAGKASSSSQIRWAQIDPDREIYELEANESRYVRRASKSDGTSANSGMLDGSIPDELGNLINLTFLDLSANQFTEGVPASFSNLSLMETLLLYGNNLNDLPDLTNLTNMGLFEVQENLLTFEDLEPNVGIPGFTYGPQQAFGDASTLTAVAGQDLTLSFTIGGTANVYQWYKDGLPVVNANLFQLDVISAQQDDAGTYTLEVTNPLVPGLILISNPITVTFNIVVQSDVDALVAFYNSTGGENWKANTNWLTGNPANTWFGVSAANGRITALNLNGNNLTGSIPTELTSLSALEILSLSANELTGSIPAELTTLTNLTHLDLHKNQFTGSIPVGFGNLTNLTSRLFLSSSQLSGPIPADLGDLVNLKWLALSDNQLSGSIPSELGNLASLEHMELGSNQLAGPIPSEFGRLNNLQILSISDNELSGAIPAEIGSLTDLTIANLSSNQLSGPIPMGLGNLTQLTNLRLDLNQLVGAVPRSFNNLTVLDTLFLSQNLLSDLPDLSGLVSVTAFEVHENRFTFEDLEPNATLTGAVYSPQANFGEASSVTINEGDPLSLSIDVPGTANQYQWKRNGSPISGATSTPFNIVNAALGDAGTYSLDVTNTLVPGLTLQSEPIGVVVSEIIIDVTEPAAVEASAGSDIPVSVTLPVNYQPQLREVCYRRSAELAYECIPLVQAGAADTGQIPSDFVTERGVDYYFQFTQGGDVTTIPPGGSEEPFRLRVEVSVLEAGGSFSETTYRMVSVPLELDNPAIESVLDEFGPYNQRNWRLFKWNAINQIFIEYPNTIASFTPCVAFWLISSTGIGFSAVNGTSLHPLQQCGERSLLLKPGWNQFGIPRAFPIDWEDVIVSDAVDAPVHYDATLNSSDPYTYDVTTLLPWDGYWVNNPGSDNVEVTFPSVASTAKTGKRKAELNFLSKSEYVLQLHASIPELKLVDEHNYLGFSSEASNGRDRIDFAEAPGIGSYVRLSLTEEELRLAGNFKSVKPEGGMWRFEVSAELHESLLFDGQIVRVAINELLPRLEGHEIYIINDDESQLVRTTDGAFSVRLNSDREVVHYRIIVGTPQFAKEVSDTITLVPQSFALEQNYPNPFNPATQIRYQLSEGSHVVLEIFNTIGQRVQKLVDQEQDVGWYEVTWDGRKYGGHSAASGVYLYRLRAGDVTLSRPMILLR